MATWLKQSTSVDVPIGPFVDQTDGFTAETGLTITQPDVRLKKNNGNWAQKAAAQTLTHEENGWYEVTLDATDTNTLGILVVAVNESGALPVWREFMVVPSQVWDSYLGADLLQVDTREVGGTSQTARDLGASVLLSAGTGAGQLDFTSGVVKANLVQILATALTETAGQIAAGFKQFFNIASPTSTMNTITTVTTATNLTTNNDKTGYALSAGGVTAVQSGLATSAALATTDARLDTEIPAILAAVDTEVAAILAAVDTEVGAVKAVTDKLDTALELDGAVYRYTTNALEQAPAGGGAPTAAQVADAVWDEAIAGHLAAGSTGAKLNGLSGASGSGAITHVITVTSNGSPVDGALVWVTTDSAGTNVVASGFTDALGHVTVFLDAGTYYQWAQRGGINFVNGQSVVVA